MNDRREPRGRAHYTPKQNQLQGKIRWTVFSRFLSSERQRLGGDAEFLRVLRDDARWQERRGAK